jgi:hypothetical protein
MSNAKSAKYGAILEVALALGNEVTLLTRGRSDASFIGMGSSIEAVQASCPRGSATAGRRAVDVSAPSALRCARMGLPLDNERSQLETWHRRQHIHS